MSGETKVYTCVIDKDFIEDDVEYLKGFIEAHKSRLDGVNAYLHTGGDNFMDVSDAGDNLASACHQHEENDCGSEIFLVFKANTDEWLESVFLDISEQLPDEHQGMTVCFQEYDQFVRQNYDAGEYDTGYFSAEDQGLDQDDYIISEEDESWAPCITKMKELLGA